MGFTRSVLTEAERDTKRDTEKYKDIERHKETYPINDSKDRHLPVHPINDSKESHAQRDTKRCKERCKKTYKDLPCQQQQREQSPNLSSEADFESF